jgi:hypothetical protein
VYFVNYEHEHNFNDLSTRVRKMKADKEYRAAGYILALPELHKKSVKYFSNNGFKSSPLIKDVDLSRGYRLMVTLARDLFNGKGFSLGRGIDVFDDKLYKVMLQAIAIRRIG